MLAGVIRPSKFLWSSPIHLVPRYTPRKWRVCGVFRHLDQQTKSDRYPIPNIHSVGVKLFKKTVFSKIDLQVNHKILLNKADISVITLFGLFEYLFIPFGLQKRSSTFQRFMDNMFINVSCVFGYIDDIFIFSESEEQHFGDLKKFLSILEENNL